MSRDNENEYEAELQQNLDAEESNIPEMTPAEHWGKIQEITKTLAVQVKDLQEALEEFSGFSPFV